MSSRAQTWRSSAACSLLRVEGRRKGGGKKKKKGEEEGRRGEKEGGREGKGECRGKERGGEIGGGGGGGGGVGLRMSSNDHLEDGQGPEGFAEIAALVAQEGIGYVALSDGNYESMDNNVSSVSGAILDHGEPQAFRRAVPDVPLLLSSTFDPDQCAEAITAGHATGIMLARQLLADPDFPRKVLEGREDQVVWCDHNNSCLRRLILNVPVRCTKNPAMGREAELSGTKVPVSVKLRRPVESALIAATGSPRLMGVADRLATAKAQRSS